MSQNNIKKFTVYGERCSGTNYLENLILKNFDVELTWEYGWKHFFGFNDVANANDTLFICIVRDPVDWINSFYNNPHHIEDIAVNPDTFLTSEICSRFCQPEQSTKQEIMEDRNMHTNEPYKNVFELRKTKLKYMEEDLHPTHKIIIRYEDLLNNFEETMHFIKNAGLKIKSKSFPENVFTYKKSDEVYVKKIRSDIPAERIYPFLDKYYENLFGYHIPDLK